MHVLQDHNCLRELRSLIQNQSGKIAELQQELAENKYQLNEQKREIQLLKVNSQLSPYICFDICCVVFCFVIYSCMEDYGCVDIHNEQYLYYSVFTVPRTLCLDPSKGVEHN